MTLLAALVLASVGVACRPLSSREPVPYPPRTDGSRAVLPVGPLRPAGRWIKDATGRTVIVHGLQLAHKGWPYLPPESGFDRSDAANIARWGFNAVRLSWFWKGLEPERGRFEPNYVARLDHIGDLLARSGVFTLLEAHQDGYNERLGGAGFPDWATIGEVPPGANGLLGEQSWAAFENLYADTDGIAQEFERAWIVLARAFRDNPALLGYDLFNEPGAGTSSLDCLLGSDGCPTFDRDVLQKFQERIGRAVRLVDDRTITFLEPNIFHDIGSPSSFGPVDAGTGPSAFAFHVYCVNRFVNPLPDRESEAPGYETCVDHDGRNVRNGEATAARMGVPPLLGEFGDTDDVADIERTVDLADDNLMGWIYWGYKDWDDNPGGQGSGPLFADSENDGTLRREKLEVLSRPYAPATAGTPLSSRFDRETRTFSYSFEPDPTISAPTAIFTGPVTYPDGYVVSVDGARVVSAPNATYLRLRARSDADVVEVRVTPRRATRTTEGHARPEALTVRPLEDSGEPPATNDEFHADATISGTCLPNAGSPLTVDLGETTSTNRTTTVRFRSIGLAGNLSGQGVRSVSFMPGDVSWATIGTTRSRGGRRLHLLCRSSGRFEIEVGETTMPPLRRSGRSTHLSNVATAASRVGFVVPRSGRYVADLELGDGSMLLGLRRSDGSTPTAVRVTNSATVELGRLRPGPVALDLVALPGPTTEWTVTVHRAEPDDTPRTRPAAADPTGDG